MKIKDIIDRLTDIHGKIGNVDVRGISIRPKGIRDWTLTIEMAADSESPASTVDPYQAGLAVDRWRQVTEDMRVLEKGGIPSREQDAVIAEVLQAGGRLAEILKPEA